MPRFIQKLAVHDKVALFLAQRAYSDFCRDAAAQARRPRLELNNVLLRYGVSAQRTEDKPGIPSVEDSENLELPVMIASPAPGRSSATALRPARIR
jgi:hypothetical protein